MATFESTSNSLTFSDTSSYIYIALQTARNIIDTKRHTKYNSECEHTAKYNVALVMF